MTFRKRLIISFSTIIVVPLILQMIGFLVLGNYMFSSRSTTRRIQSYSSLTDAAPKREMAARLYDTVAARLSQDPAALESDAYLAELSASAADCESYLILTREGQVIYTDDRKETDLIMDQLPGIGEERALLTDSEWKRDDSVYYIGTANEAVRRLAFTFRDGRAGMLYIVTGITVLISPDFLSGLMISMVVTLAITAILLTRWLEKSFFGPIGVLNLGMGSIRDGNLDYPLRTSEKGEIGELYRNYEEMRLRLKESTDEKLERERANRELISNICHDLKTPITSIKGYVEGLIDGVANTPEKREKYIRTIYNKACDLDRLINELTLYSRIDNDRVPYNFHRVSVSDYFGDCVEEIGIDLEQRGIELNYSNMVPPGTRIIADPEQMKRVINNIVGNSVKYIDKPHGRIDIRILDEEDSIRVEIEDNGKGIGARDLPYIFDRFYRTDSSRNSSQGGSGIGLSIVKKVIEDHGGYIWATSTLGEGTCMHFVLRKYMEQNRAAQSESWTV